MKIDRSTFPNYDDTTQVPAYELKGDILVVAVTPEPVMKEKLRFLGLDVHVERIAAAITEPDGQVRSLGTIPNRMESIRKLIKKLGPVEKLRVCYDQADWLCSLLAVGGLRCAVRGDRPVQHGVINALLPSGLVCANDNRARRKGLMRLHGRHNTDYISDT
jgi:hypothetical protein